MNFKYGIHQAAEYLPSLFGIIFDSSSVRGFWIWRKRAMQPLQRRGCRFENALLGHEMEWNRLD